MDALWESKFTRLVLSGEMVEKGAEGGESVAYTSGSRQWGSVGAVACAYSYPVNVKLTTHVVYGSREF